MGLHRAPFWHWHRLLQWGPQWSLSQPAGEEQVRAEGPCGLSLGCAQGESKPKLPSMSASYFPTGGSKGYLGGSFGAS